MRQKHLLALSVIVLLFVCVCARGQQCTYNFDFASGSAEFRSDYQDNEANLSLLEELVTTVGAQNVISVEIFSKSAPEGSTFNNLDLSRRRIKAMHRYVVDKFPGLGGRVVENVAWETWKGLRAYVVHDSMLSDAHKSEIVSILDSKDADISSVKSKLEQHPQYRYLVRNYYPKLRSSGITVYYNAAKTPGELAARTISASSEVFARAAAASFEGGSDRGSADPVQSPETEQPARQEDEDEIDKSICRIGTNLLYDIATVANLYVEVGFAKHVSLNVLATFSPWDIKPDLKLRSLILQPEVRYYFADNFRGHHVGLDGHFGWYNVALGGKERWQDRDANTPLWGAGLSYGYLLRINDHLGMDFYLGGGYARLDYDCFYNINNGAKFTSRTKDWWGLTKAGISIYFQF